MRRATRGDFDLNLLVPLHILLEEQNVTRAAARLRIGQPALSATLAKLRDVFNDPLLVREGRGLVRTEVANQLREPVAEALGQVEALVNERHHFDPSSSHVTFTVLTSDFVALMLVHPLMRELEAEAPHVRLQTRPLTADFGDRLRSGSAELAILPSAVADDTSGLHTHVVFSDNYVYLADPHNDLARRAQRWEDFAALPHLGYSGEEVPSVAQVDLRRMAGLIGQDVTTETFLLSAYLVQGTSFVCLAPGKLAQLAADRFGLTVAKPPTELTVMRETAYWSERTAGDAANQWLRDRLIKAGKALP